MNGNRPRNAAAGVRRNVTALLQDAFRLADLQFQLLAVDLTEIWGTARLAAGVCLVAAIASLGALPVILLGMAYLLSTWMEISIAAAALTVGGITLLASGLAVWICLRRFASVERVLKRSRNEFRENVEWFRQVLHKERDDDE